MTNEAIEAAARAIRENDSWRTWKGDEAFVRMARAAAPALMEEGARLALEAAAEVASWAHMVPPDGGSPTEDECAVAIAATEAIRALDPAAIVKGAGYD